jgi:hypothetical protein
VDTLDEFYERFRLDAEKLPPESRARVLAVLEHEEPRTVFLHLDRLLSAHVLPATWEPMLTEFFWSIR